MVSWAGIIKTSITRHLKDSRWVMPVLPTETIFWDTTLSRTGDIRYMKIPIQKLTPISKTQHSSLQCLTSIPWNCVIRLLPTLPALYLPQHGLRLPTDGTITRAIILSGCAAVQG